MALASALPEAQVVAVDLLPTMAEEANRRFRAAGFDNRVVAVVGDMRRPPVAPGSQHLIWCEGAIYNLGVTAALGAWRPLLEPGGTVAFTEPVWLVSSPPKEVHDWWLSEYPAITDSAGVRAQVTAASFQTVASFVLPASAWWDGYYQPMQSRIADLRARLPDDLVATGIADAAEAEIGYFQRFADCYSYEFFVVQPSG